ncbi:MAG: type II secretion system protein GspD [Gammaproteobacteria bacterium]
MDSPGQWKNSALLPLLLGCLLGYFECVHGAPTVPQLTDRRITLSVRDNAVQEVYEILSREGRVNILLGKGVEGTVSVNLFNVTLEEAIRAVAYASGYVVENRDRTYMILSREDAGKDLVDGNTVIRTVKVQYTDPEIASQLLTKHLSRYGKITTIAQRRLLVIEDLPDFIERAGRVLAEIDVPPQQLLIEAKILEIVLTSDDAFGIDWSRAFRALDGVGDFGTRGLNPGGAGFFFRLLTPDLQVFLTALSEAGRVRTLSTPKLLVLENQEAEVVIGDRLGFKVTTTINQVTTESIEFIESGVILRVKAAVDRAGGVILWIHPEVSTGSVTDGIPSVKTTEVTTQLLATSGQAIFIGGLIKDQLAEKRAGVPLLKEVPLLGPVFSRKQQAAISTETVVIITPRIVGEQQTHLVEGSAARIHTFEQLMGAQNEKTAAALSSRAFHRGKPSPRSAAPDDEHRVLRELY